jgi:hypothetical protein
MNPADEMAAKSDQQLHTILGRVAHQDDLHSGFTPRLDLEALERKAIYDRLVAIENQMKRRGSGGFARYLAGILIGVAATFAWQSWTKPLAGHETTAVQPPALETPQAATVAQTASETVASKAPATPLHRPGANAAANAQYDHPAANRRPNRRRSRRNETCNRQAGVRCGGSTCEAARASAAAAARRSSRAQADADRAAVLASSNTTAPSTSPINSARLYLFRG